MQELKWVFITTINLQKRKSMKKEAKRKARIEEKRARKGNDLKMMMKK